MSAGPGDSPVDAGSALGEGLCPPGPHTLSDLIPAMAARTGVPRLGLPAARRWVVVLVDGMGSANLAEHTSLTPHLCAMSRGAELTCQVPSTTATSLSCLGTGAPPGRHGVMGYTFRAPSGRIMNALSWDNGDDPRVVQPHRTAFEELGDAGVTVTSVGPAHFESSGLTRASLRGARFVPVRDEEDVDLRADLTARAARDGDSSLTYVYERSLDHVGHGHGWRSPQWRSRLMWVDELVEALSEALDPGTALVVTADHGMVDVPGNRRVLVEDEAGMLADVSDLAGEPRLRQVYTSQSERVARRWADVLGERARVLLREEAVAAGLFGSVEPENLPRIGDVLALMRDDWAVMTRARRKELSLVGMHGSLTPTEMGIPLFHEICGC